MQYVSVTAHSVDPGYVDPGCMDVVCHFASGSWAKGCKISAILVEQDEELLICEYSIARKREKSVSMAIALPEGEYRLLVYDVEAVSNAELPNPAFTTHITVEDSSVTGILYEDILRSGILRHTFDSYRMQWQYLPRHPSRQFL